MRKHLILLCALCLLPLPGTGQLVTPSTTASDDFPALQFLPVGSVVEGISIPRYENHRVNALLLAEKLIIKTRKSVILEKLSASLYADDGTQTDVRADSIHYHFGTKTAHTTGEATVQDPRFSASGNGVIFNTSTRKGFLRGPVTTIISTAKLNQKKGRNK